jgi:hypothetical protein
LATGIPCATNRAASSSVTGIPSAASTAATASAAVALAHAALANVALASSSLSGRGRHGGALAAYSAIVSSYTLVCLVLLAANSSSVNGCMRLRFLLRNLLYMPLALVTAFLNNHLLIGSVLPLSRLALSSLDIVPASGVSPTIISCIKALNRV